MSTGQEENFCIEVPPSVSRAEREFFLSTGTLKGTPGTQCSPLQYLQSEVHQCRIPAQDLRFDK